MESVKSENLRYKVEMSTLKIRPNNISLFGSIALGYFYELTKDKNIETCEQALNHLYKDWNSVIEILKNAGLEGYLDIFSSFSSSLKHYKNFSGCMQDANYSEMMNSIYYFFVGLYSFHLKSQIFESLPYEFELFSQHLEYFLSQIQVQVTLYKQHEVYMKIGNSYLNIDISETNPSDYHLIVSIHPLQIPEIEFSHVENMFKYVLVPKELFKLDKLIELIHSFQNQFKKITPEMQKILKLRENWTCSHDLKTITPSCGKKHCINCLFDLIKNDVREKSRCPCGVQLTDNEHEKTFKYVEPNYDRFFKCSACSRKFKISSSVFCETHQTCLDCRQQNKRKCFICSRDYTEEEKRKKFFIQDERQKIKEKKPDVEIKKKIKKAAKMPGGFKCKVCGRESGKRECVNLCDVCSVCYTNILNCIICKVSTELKLVYKCVVCKGDKGISQKQILKCKHPCHDACKPKHKCD